MENQQQQQDQHSLVPEQSMRGESSQPPVDQVESEPSTARAAKRVKHQVGTDADDILVANPGREWLIGGKGNDTYIVDDENSKVLEKQDEGWDTVRASVGFTLRNHVERLELTGNADLYGGGNRNNNRLIGNVGNNMLYGFKGNDSIDGAAGDDTLLGHRGNDRLVGGPGDDYLDGGFGNDVLVGGTGNDTYELRRSMGQDYIYDEDATPGNVDTIHATTALRPDDVEVLRDGDDLLLRIHLTTSGVRIGNWFGAPRFCVEQVRFDDGTVWDVAAIKARLAQDPAGSADLAFGQGWATDIARQQQEETQGVADLLGQRKRQDSIFNHGSPATDTLTMKRGGLIDMVSPAPLWTQYVDMIKIDADIAPTDLKLMRDHDDLILLAVGGKTGFLRVRHGFDRARIEFADGTVWDSPAIREDLKPQLRDGRFVQRSFVEQVVNSGVFYGYDDSRDVLDGSRDGDWIYGFGGDDILNGHDGRDRMDGGAGNDRMAGGRHADIMHGGAGNDFMDGGKGADYLDGGAGDDTLVGGTGDDIIDGGDGDDRIDGGGGNDVVHGGAGRDLMRGGAGNDLLYGGIDGDTYYLESGMGQDIVQEEDDTRRGGNIVDVGAGLRPADIVLVRNGTDLQIGSGDLQDRLTLKSLFDGGTPYIDAVLFSNDQRWSFPELERRSIARSATAGDDVLHGKGGAQWWEGDPLYADIHDVLDGMDGADQLWGHAGNDVLAGGGGDDLITGGAGSDLLAGGTGRDRLVCGSQSDVIVFNRGDGNDTIAFQDAATGSAAASDRGPTLSLGGVRCNELALRKSGSDLVLEMQSGDSVRFEDWYTSPAQTRSTLLQLVTDSTDDYLPGSDDVLRRRKTAHFDFNSMAAQYDRAREALPGLDSWSATAALTHHHLSGNDMTAVGGEPAYHYAHHGQWRQMGADAMSAGLVSPLFGNSDQAITRPAGALLPVAG